MSAPDTNVSKQKRRHRPALLGIKGAILFGVAMLLLLLLYSAYWGGAPTADAVTNTDQATQPTVVVPDASVAPTTND